MCPKHGSVWVRYKSLFIPSGSYECNSKIFQTVEKLLKIVLGESSISYTVATLL